MPDTAQAVALLAIVAIVLGFGLVAVSATYGDTYEHVEVQDEAVSQDVGNWTAVDAADEALAFDDAVTVRNSTGATLVEGQDYEWAANGSISFLTSPNTTDGATATIDYGYDRRPEQATTMLAPLRTMFEATGVLPWAIVAGAVFTVARSLAGSVGSTTYGGRR